MDDFEDRIATPEASLGAETLPRAKAHAHPPSEASARSGLCLKLNAELLPVAISNVKSTASPPRRIFETASWLVTYGVTTLEAFRGTDEIVRSYPSEDLRKTEKVTFYSSPSCSSLRDAFFPTIRKCLDRT